jgi:hypothetical protein
VERASAGRAGERAASRRARVEQAGARRAVDGGASRRARGEQAGARRAGGGGGGASVAARSGEQAGARGRAGDGGARRRVPASRCRWRRRSGRCKMRDRQRRARNVSLKLITSERPCAKPLEVKAYPDRSTSEYVTFERRQTSRQKLT